MRASFLGFGAVVVAFCAGIFACTASADVDDSEIPPSDARIPAPDAAADAPLAVDAGPCPDCEYFPEACSPDIFCPNGPFDARDSNSLDPRTVINVIRGRSITDVWAGGALGALAHFDGRSWTRSDPATEETMRGLWLFATSEVALGALDHFFLRDAAVVDAGATPSPGGWTVRAPSYAPGRDAPANIFLGAWSVPGGASLWCALQYGGLWRLRRSPAGTFDGTADVSPEACETFGCSNILSIHGATPSELWAVGARGATIRIKDAEGVTPMVKTFNSQTTNALRGVWEGSASDAWSVGAGGTIRHYTGDPLVWEIVANVPTQVDLNAVWGFSSSDVWAVGDAGVVLHYDGTSWSRVKIAGLGRDRPDLTTVWGPASGHVWIGGQGVIISLGGRS